MSKKFEEIYNKLQAAEDKETEREKVMKALEELHPYAPFMYHKFEEMKDLDNAYLNFDSCIQEDNAAKRVEAMAACGITQFTFSAAARGANSTALAFKQNGCKVVDIVEVNIAHKGKGYYKRAAYVFQI